MSKVRRIACTVVIPLLLLAGAAWAGPGGSHSGDPDGPQIAHPARMSSGVAGSLDVQDSRSVHTTQVPDGWKVVLRMMLRFYGITVR